MSHTPGPWVVSNDTIGSDHGDIASIHYQSSRAARGWEDRFVIAAAPEMLAALRDAVDFIKGHNECLGPATHGSDQEWIDYCVSLHKSCMDVIAKAEGSE